MTAPSAPSPPTSARPAEANTSVFATWADVGILVSCALSLLFRVAVFHARRRANECALRACCEAEEDLQQLGEPVDRSAPTSGTQRQSLERQTVADAECYMQFASTTDFMELRFSSTVTTPHAEDTQCVPMSTQALWTSRAEACVRLEQALASGAAQKKDWSGDPVLILLQLPLERRLQTMVNWLSVISNSLTYYLRPSQVLYAFVFNMADFFLFVVSVAEGRHRCALLAELMRSTDDMVRNPNVAAAPTGSSSTTPSVPVLSTHELGAAAAVKRTLRGSRAGEPPVRSRWRRHVTVACVRPFQCLIGGLVTSLTMTVDALQVCLLSALSFVTPAAEDGSGGSTTRRQTGAAAVTIDDGVELSRVMNLTGHPDGGASTLSPAETVDAARDGPGHTGVRELLLLNAAFAFALVLFHMNHLLFGIGAVAGYVAGAMNLFLLGCAMARACEQFRLWWSCVSRRRSEKLPTGTDTKRSSWSVVLAHWCAAACAVFYFFMLLDEGAVLWATHVNFVRWYAATAASGLTELVLSFTV